MATPPRPPAPIQGPAQPAPSSSNPQQPLNPAASSRSNEFLPQQSGGLKGRRRAPSIRGTSALASKAGTKIGPQRTTKNSQKLKILPSPADQDEESGREGSPFNQYVNRCSDALLNDIVYSQLTRIKDTTARRDAERLGKAERARLPRVTAYATANSYKMPEIAKFLKARASTRGAAPKKFDECIYTPFSYSFENRYEDQRDLIDLQDAGSEQDGLNGDDNRSLLDFVAEQNQAVTSSEVFLFQYGVVVIWGMSLEEEQRFLRDIAKFETEKLGDDDIQVENFNFYVTSSYQPRIYNDFITLKDGRNYMIKLSISHAIAQSVKISLFEDLVDNTIEDTKSIPTDIATSGKVKMSRREIMKHIGELFILRININLQGSVLDSPELMWAEPQLEPVYQAARSYLEINQRVSLLNQRLDVIGDLLQMLKEQMSHSQGEHLEWIVIVLIAAEILVACANIIVDVFAAD